MIVSANNNQPVCPAVGTNLAIYNLDVTVNEILYFTSILIDSGLTVELIYTNLKLSQQEAINNS